MSGRKPIVEELIESIDAMLEVIEEQEIIEPDYAVAREVAEQLREELSDLQE